MLLWAVAIGALVGTIPFNWLYDRYGARWVFFAAGLVSAAATGAIPFAASLGLYEFLLIRLIQVCWQNDRIISTF
jgi:MFS family permease